MLRSTRAVLAHSMNWVRSRAPTAILRLTKSPQSGQLTKQPYARPQARLSRQVGTSSRSILSLICSFISCWGVAHSLLALSREVGAGCEVVLRREDLHYRYSVYADFAYCVALAWLKPRSESGSPPSQASSSPHPPSGSEMPDQAKMDMYIGSKRGLLRVDGLCSCASKSCIACAHVPHEPE